jgi:hypothetical protein
MKLTNYKMGNLIRAAVQGSCLAAAMIVMGRAFDSMADDKGGEVLYNGIQLPRQWPPMTPIKNLSVRTVPYLANPPAVIPIDVGRQLFVDDFLIDNTTLKREFHYPERYAGNPILKPETPVELNKGLMPSAAMISDGVCYDPQAAEFKMWYHAGWRDGTMLATSQDGLHWIRPNLDVEPGDNRVIPKRPKLIRHGAAMVLDSYTTDPQQRFKMLLYEGNATSAYTSPDGIHWTDQGKVTECGDNATMFYNPFRQKWVYSIRLYRMGRARDYYETTDFLQGMHWNPADESPWENCDTLDLPDPAMLAMMPKPEEIKAEANAAGKTYDQMLKSVRSGYGDPVQLYNLDAIPYESIMLGVYGILRGPTTGQVWDKLRIVKRNDLELAYSRDGFNWDRPDRTPFLACTRHDGDWDAGYLHIGVGICTVMGDKLYFYYSGWSGKSPQLGNKTYAGGATGVAMLRRDGFASMNAGDEQGALTTRPVTFKGKYLFANVAAPQGELKAEVLDENGAVIAPFSADNCVAVTGDHTKVQVTWKGAGDLSALAGKIVKFRFLLKQGELYSFWVSPDANGASHGYVAAGGPAFPGTMDTVGK